jgi:hypothetical protein
MWIDTLSSYYSVQKNRIAGIPIVEISIGIFPRTLTAPSMDMTTPVKAAIFRYHLAKDE